MATTMDRKLHEIDFMKLQGQAQKDILVSIPGLVDNSTGECSSFVPGEESEVWSLCHVRNMTRLFPSLLYR